MRVPHTFVILLTAMLLMPAGAVAQHRPSVPDDATHRAVDIWSEGTRMAGDLYWSADAGCRPS